ncbi:MAG: hypothetical protein JJE25_04950 [Bacteroidia bacterium]|nr:hypothetical protein [Bacteroidia bacterium]
MNRQLFLRMLEHPDTISETENITLKKFTEDFPFCQTGQLLFVKHLHSQSSVHFPEQLKIAAAYSSDRKILYHLIHSASPLSVAGKSLEHVEEVAEEIPVPLIHKENVVEESIEPQDIIQKRLQEISELRKTEAVSEKQEEKKTDDPPVAEIIPLTPESKEPKPETIPAVEDIIVPEPEIISKKEEPTPAKINSEENDTAIINDQHSFTGWLKAIKKEPLVESKKPEKKAKPASASDEIISRFIETEPRIKPSKVQFYSPVKMAKLSLEEHDDLVSETLAGIFAQQGNFPKAIEMYKKLMLLNPEKSAFFASLIEKLNQQLNTGK